MLAPALHVVTVILFIVAPSALCHSILELLGFLLSPDGRDHDTILVVREIGQVFEILGPTVANLTQLMKVNITSLTHAASKDLGLTTSILLLEHGVGDPVDAHTGTTTSLDTRD